MKQLGILIMLITLSACTAKYDVIRHESKQLSTTDSFYVSKPENGTYGTIHYNESGRMTRDAFFNQLSKLGVKAVRDMETRDKASSLIAAKEQQCSALIYPTILHWEDRATEWSGLRDRAQIQVEIINTETGETVDNTTLDLVGTWWTFGGLHPQDMVVETVEDYFQQLFGYSD